MVERREAYATERGLRAHDVLAGALAESREALSSGAARSHGGELDLIDELLAELAPERPAEELAAWLAASAGPNGERRQALGDVIGSLARRLPRSGEPWRALVTALDRVFGSGVQPLGRLPFISDALLELLLAEARQQLPQQLTQHEGSSRPAPGPPGRALASLAVSPKLVEAVTTAFGFAVVPTYDAVYLFDPPGSHVRTHVDTRDYELVFHLILEHTLPSDGSSGSALLVHLPTEPEPTRLPIGLGEGVALRGRGTIHSWEPLRDDEDRIMVAIGFASVT